jgi:hypothetical protein
MPLIEWRDLHVTVLACQPSLLIRLSDLLAASNAGHERADSRTVRHVFTALSGAVHALHTQSKVIHGDLTPTNVLLARNGHVGLAHPAFLTQGVVAAPATPCNVAPKGVTGPSADLFFLGALLLWIAAGHPPWPGNTDTELRLAYQGGRLPELPSHIIEEEEACTAGQGLGLGDVVRLLITQPAEAHALMCQGRLVLRPWHARTVSVSVLPPLPRSRTVSITADEISAALGEMTAGPPAPTPAPRAAAGAMRRGAGAALNLHDLGVPGPAAPFPNPVGVYSPSAGIGSGEGSRKGAARSPAATGRGGLAHSPPAAHSVVPPSPTAVAPPALPLPLEVLPRGAEAARERLLRLRAEKDAAEVEAALTAARIAAFEDRQKLAQKAQGIFESSNAVAEAAGSGAIVVAITGRRTALARSPPRADVFAPRSPIAHGEEEAASAYSDASGILSPRALRRERLIAEAAAHEEELTRARIAAFAERQQLAAKHANGRR